MAIIRPCVKEACCKYSDSVWCHFTAFTPSASFFPSTRPCAPRLPVGAQLPLTVSLCQSASLGSWKERKKKKRIRNIGDGQREREKLGGGRKERGKKGWMDEGWMDGGSTFLTRLVCRIKSWLFQVLQKMGGGSLSNPQSNPLLLLLFLHLLPSILHLLHTSLL